MGGGALSDCECAQLHHEKLTDPKSEPTQTAHNEQETQQRKSIWEDVSFRWMSTRFSFGRILPVFFGQLVLPSSLKKFWKTLCASPFE